MSIIKCPKCSNEISDTEEKCRYCGYPIKKTGKETSLKEMLCGIICIAVVVAVCIVFVGFMGSRLDKDEREKVTQVINAIASIDETESDCGEKILKAEKLYASLSEKCKKHVKNYDKLVSAREEYSNYRIKETMELINQIGTVTLDSELEIKEARKAYDELTDDEKDKVTNYNDLLAAEDSYIDEQLEKEEGIQENPNSENSFNAAVSPEFKEAMDSYEAFFDEYCNFMKKYSNADSTAQMSMLTDYINYMAKYIDMMEKLGSIENNLSEKEALYYAEVTARIYKKLMEIGQ